MTDKRKRDPNQLSLPVTGPKPAQTEPKKTARAEAKKSGDGAANPPAADRKKNGNGTEIVAEPVPEQLAHAHRPFFPSKIELPLHRRVDRSFLSTTPPTSSATAPSRTWPTA